MRKHILHPTDFSPGAEAAFARALETTRREHGELVLVHVLEGLMPPRREAYAAREFQVRTAVEAAVRTLVTRCGTTLSTTRVGPLCDGPSPGRPRDPPLRADRERGLHRVDVLDDLAVSVSRTIHSLLLAQAEWTKVHYPA